MDSFRDTGRQKVTETLYRQRKREWMWMYGISESEGVSESVSVIETDRQSKKNLTVTNF